MFGIDNETIESLECPFSDQEIEEVVKIFQMTSPHVQMVSIMNLLKAAGQLLLMTSRA
jgi:hypothetical protein